MAFRKLRLVDMMCFVIPVITIGCTSSPSSGGVPAAATDMTSAATEQDTEATTAATPAGTEAIAALNALQVDLVKVVDGLKGPTSMVEAPDGSGRLFVVEKPGTVRIIKDGQLLPEPFLDISSKVTVEQIEQGFLDLAFSPDYARDGRFYVSYTALNNDLVVSRFSVGEDPDQADASSGKRVFLLEKTLPTHNGGHIVFGPDGYFYLGLGDGGSRTIGDFGFVTGPQRGANLVGKILRLDVETLPYKIPPDNPFANTEGMKAEIWDTGLRNPWRFSFDRETGDLYISDVGEGTYEEVNFEPAGSGGGRNYGWPFFEGNHCLLTSTICDDITSTVKPILEYSHDEACAIIGGYVYRGADFPQMDGIYTFGDYCSGKIWGAAPSSDGTWTVRELMTAPFLIHSFAEDAKGELYVLDGQGGALYRLTAR